MTTVEGIEMPGAQPVVLTVDQLEALLQRASSPAMSEDKIEEIVSKGVTRAFTTIGISAEDPLEMQKDFAFIRSLRVGSASLKTHGLVALTGVMVTALTTLIWLGFKTIWSAK